MLGFWCSKLHFWRKSRTKASFLSFKASFLKEVSQKCFVFGFKASILKEVSQKCFVFDLQSFVFEGSLAEMLRFWASKLHFWRKSRTKASFPSFKASFVKEVSQKCFVFDLQSFVFEGSRAEMLRFWASKLHFWRKSRTKASFPSFKASFVKEVSQKCFVFDLQSFVFEGSRAEQLQSVSHSVTQSVSQSVSQLVRSISQSVSQIVSQSVSQPISQSDSQSVSQSVSQSALN